MKSESFNRAKCISADILELENRIDGLRRKRLFIQYDDRNDGLQNKYKLKLIEFMENEINELQKEFDEL